MASNTPATIHRQDYTFQHLLTYDKQLWNTLYQQAMQAIVDFKTRNTTIIGGDIDTQMVFKARRNLNKFSFGRFIEVQHTSFDRLEHERFSKGFLICNPPYGQRIDADTSALYEQLGSWMKHQLKGFNCWILSGSVDGMKSIGLKPKTKLKLFNGSLECSFRHYAIY